MADDTVAARCRHAVAALLVQTDLRLEQERAGGLVLRGLVGDRVPPLL
jgi:hypothetical protein